jgi:hypothetical protein
LECHRQRTNPKDIAYSLYFKSLKVFPIEALQKHYIDSSIEAMSPSGNGFKNTNQRNFQPREARSMDILSMELKLKLAINTYGYGL